MTDFKNEDVWLMQGNCLDRMKDIPDGSVDLVLCDPPYQTTKISWDSMIPFDSMWANIKRVLKPEGTVVLTAAQPFTSKLILSNIRDYKYNYVWEKNNVTKFLSSKINPLSKHEDICVFINSYEIEFANYLKEMRLLSGFSKSEMDRKLGSNTLYTFFEGRNLRGEVVYSKPNKEHYSILKVLLNLSSKWDHYIDKSRTFHHVGVVDVEKQFKGKRVKHSNDSHYSFNSDGYTKEKEGFTTSILKFCSESNTIHPTQKPVALMEYLINTYTNEGETVLDFTFGSGSTIKAALNTNRKSIGIELGKCEKKNHKYFGMDWTDVLIDQLDLK